MSSGHGFLSINVCGCVCKKRERHVCVNLRVQARRAQECKLLWGHWLSVWL